MFSSKDRRATAVPCEICQASTRYMNGYCEKHRKEGSNPKMGRNCMGEVVDNLLLDWETGDPVSFLLSKGVRKEHGFDDMQAVDDGVFALRDQAKYIIVRTIPLAFIEVESTGRMYTSMLQSEPRTVCS
jgi:hypothetical protein